MSNSFKDNSKGLTSKTPQVYSSSGIKSLLKNENQEFVVRKSERLASALYVITGFLSPEEPIRTRLRACALDLINCSTDKDKLNGPGVDFFSAKCVEISSILETAQSGGLISPMNAKLICDEYASLATFVGERQESIVTKSASIKDTIGDEQPNQEGSSIGQSSRTFKRTENVSVRKLRIGADSSGFKSDRKQSVLNLMSERPISIKDVSVAMPEYSEKTIQRELLSMVRDGLLIKEGERRWSTYKKA